MIRSAAIALLATPVFAQAPAALDAYDVVWRTPSRDASGSMPIGNGELGCNVWCEADGRLCFHVSRTDAFSEASRLLKLGTVTVRVRPPEENEFFEQRLCLRDGCIRVVWGEGERRVAMKLFVDAAADVVHVLAETARDEEITVHGETWRTERRRLQGDELRSSWTMHDAPADVVVEEDADRGVVVSDGRLGFRHRNERSVVAFTVARQGLATQGAPRIADPLLFRAFGLLLGGPGLTRAPSSRPLHPVLRSPRARSFSLRVAAPCVQDVDETAWQRRAIALLESDDADDAGAQARSTAWWHAFWARSWVFVTGDTSPGVPANDHPLRIGVDSDGGNRFHGVIADVTVKDGDEVVFTAPTVDVPLLVDSLRGRAFTRSLRIEATVTQDEGHAIGRIVDKVTAGGSDGFLFDTHPGRALRLIVGDRQLIAERALTPGVPHRVAAGFDPASGRMELELDGKVVKTNDAPLDAAPPSRITQALVLQRWIQAAGGRGHYPIKFNGSIFTVEPEFTGGPRFDADWRKWGDCYWWQNTRLPYYPMLAQGDFEMTEPLFRLYRDTLPAARERVRAWYDGKVEGAYWPETMTLFGTHGNGDYGWKRDGLPPSKVLCPWWEYARNQGLELLALMLDRWDFERDPRFVAEQILPLAEPVLAWFATAYPRDAAGTLRITPTQAVETYWHGVTDDMPTVAGLHWVLARLLELPDEQLAGAPVAQWRKLLAELPPIPLRDQDGQELLAPAGVYDSKRSNCENPELYAVFPFRHYGLGKPELDVARRAFAARHDRFSNGWPQDGQDAALLGFLDEARTNLLAKAQNHHRAHRFPAMWGPNFDWCPDQDHGSNLLDTAHRMLLQCDGARIHVLPCWPKDWDVAFKLHAPRRTTVEVVWRAGKMEKLLVTPAERRADVVQTTPSPRAKFG
ncbi:MAG: hypothetical protein HZB39_16025 [Planctomycetes bacterium]|nr:hypothetical protein [Planctomycetota bacterium]